MATTTPRHPARCAATPCRWRSPEPVRLGLMMANYLGQMGIDVLVVEKLDTLDRLPARHRH